MQPWGYIVLVGAVAIVYAIMLPARSKNGQAQQQSLKETEAALELYMADLERENDELVKLVESIKQQSQASQAAMEEEVSELRAGLEELRQQIQLLEGRLAEEEKERLEWSHLCKETSRELKVFLANGTIAEGNDGEKPLHKRKPVSSVRLRYPRLFEMHEEGKSIDAIAGAAGMQRGEVQLILQLAKQEESV